MASRASCTATILPKPQGCVHQSALTCMSRQTPRRPRGSSRRSTRSWTPTVICSRAARPAGICASQPVAQVPLRGLLRRRHISTTTMTILSFSESNRCGRAFGGVLICCQLAFSTLVLMYNPSANCHFAAFLLFFSFFQGDSGSFFFFFFCLIHLESRSLALMKFAGARMIIHAPNVHSWVCFTLDSRLPTS